MFNGHTNITSDRFLVFGVKGLVNGNENVKDALLFNVLSYLSDKLLTAGNTVAALDELRRELAEAEQAYSDAKVAVSELCAGLEDVNQQSVITRRYISGQSWEKIALDMDMSVRSVQKLHGRALPLLDALLKAREAA